MLFLLHTATEMPLALMPFIYTGDDSVTTHASRAVPDPGKGILYMCTHLSQHLHGWALKMHLH